MATRTGRPRRGDPAILAHPPSPTPGEPSLPPSPRLVHRSRPTHYHPEAPIPFPTHSPRPPCPNPSFLGIEIGGTKLQLGLGHGDGTILALTRLDVAPTAGAPAIRDQIATAVGPLLDRVGRSRIDAAAIGFGGPVDSERGRVTVSHHVPGWSDFPLVDWLRDLLHNDLVALHNDADTAALGEARFGAGAGFSPVLYVNSGSGIGGGLIVDGRIYRGSGSGALEIGHLWIEPPTSDRPGSTLESLASGWSIARQARDLAASRPLPDSSPLLRLADGRPDLIDTPLVFQAAALGDPDALSVLDRATTAFAQALAHAVTLLAPRRLILGGGVSLASPDLWLSPIARHLDRLVFPPFLGTFDLLPASLGELVVLHGSLALARDLLA